MLELGLFAPETRGTILEGRAIFLTPRLTKCTCLRPSPARGGTSLSAEALGVRLTCDVSLGGAPGSRRGRRDCPACRVVNPLWGRGSPPRFPAMVPLLCIPATLPLLGGLQMRTPRVTHPRGACVWTSHRSKPTADTGRRRMMTITDDHPTGSIYLNTPPASPGPRRPRLLRQVSRLCPTIR